MRNGFLGSMTALVVGAGLAVAQPAAVVQPAPVVAPRGVAAHEVVVPDGMVQPTVVTGEPIPALFGDGGGCGGCYPKCGPAGDFWFNAEYLVWWTNGTQTPALAISGPAGATPRIGDPGVSVLFGGESINDEARSGLRLGGGLWLSQYHDLGVETSWFLLESGSTSFSTSSTGGPGAPNLAVPFIDVTPPAIVPFENGNPVAVNGVSGGSINANVSTRLYGGEVNALINYCCGPQFRLDFIGGARMLSLDEGLGLTQVSQILPTVPFIGGSNLAITDTFDTTTRFYGGQFGTRLQVWSGDLIGSFVAKLAVGNSHEIVDIRGSSLLTSPRAAPFVASSGFFSQLSNRGRHTRDQLAIVPEFGVNLGYQLTRVLRVSAGYSFLYWSDVVRPGNEIDRGVNLTQVPTRLGAVSPLVGMPRPAFSFQDTDYWAQGLNFSLEFRF